MWGADRGRLGIGLRWGFRAREAGRGGVEGERRVGLQGSVGQDLTVCKVLGDPDGTAAEWGLPESRGHERCDRLQSS